MSEQKYPKKNTFCQPLEHSNYFFYFLTNGYKSVVVQPSLHIKGSWPFQIENSEDSNDTFVFKAEALASGRSGASTPHSYESSLLV